MGFRVEGSFSLYQHSKSLSTAVILQLLSVLAYPDYGYERCMVIFTHTVIVVAIATVVIAVTKSVRVVLKFFC